MQPANPAEQFYLHHNKYKIITVRSKDERDKFLSLPALLYSKCECMQNIGLERKLLEKKHILSHTADILPLIIIDEKNIYGRCLLTFYKNDAFAYIGFFECINDIDVCAGLLNRAAKLALQKGKTALRGPLNFSFWLGYRFKTDDFGKPYACEPYNKEYYPLLWQKCGFKLCNSYVSNIYRQVPADCKNSKYRRRLQYMTECGYRFIHPNFFSFGRHLKKIYAAISKLYSGFAGYSHISEADFIKLYSPLKWVLDFDMVFLVYKGSELEGFLICLPDYQNLLTVNLSPVNIVRLVLKHLFPDRYIILYMGAFKPGLGSAMAELARERLRLRSASSVGALIHSGKASGGYFKALIEKTQHYIFMERILTVQS